MNIAGLVAISYIAVCLVIAVLSVPDLLQTPPAPPRKKVKR